MGGGKRYRRKEEEWERGREGEREEGYRKKRGMLREEEKRGRVRESRGRGGRREGLRMKKRGTGRGTGEG